MHDTMIRQADVWKTCNKLRAAAFRVGLSLWDWYRPLDPDGNSLISESKFVSVLAGPLRALVGLTDAEVGQLAGYFRAQDGRVHYRQLCQLVHGEESEESERRSAECVLEACPPPPEPACHQLAAWQRRRLCCLLATIAARDLPLRPYFQDYELVAKNDGRITFAHFARILNYIGIIVSPEDFNLLVRRFIKDSYTLDYVEFLKAVEAVKKEGIAGLGPEYQNPKAVLDTSLPKLSRPEPLVRPASEVFHPALRPPRDTTRDLLQLMLRVQQFVLQRSVRASEFFRDYDPLNSGRIAPENFRRAVDAMGLGQVLAPDEVLCIMRHYLDPNDSQRVCWRTFEDDCDQVFAVKELEKHPTAAAGAAVSALGAAGAAEGLDARALDACQAALLRVRAAVTERAIDLRPAFHDHDLHNGGHVSRGEVRRVLARLGVLPAAHHVLALEDRYLDDVGFNYVALLEELEERPVESAAQAGSRAGGGGAAPHAGSAAPAHNPLETDIVHILAHIKGKMVREGVRPLEFVRQFDQRRELVVPRADFYRGLAAAGLSLTPLQMDTLMEVFAAPGRRRLVEYERFGEVVGEALTQAGLERAPLLQPVPHVPTADSPLYFLNFEERSIVSAALAKLSKFPDQVSNILEVFKDMDRARCGSVQRVSAERALGQRGLLPLLSPRERDLLYRCFGCRRGCGDEVNYRALVNALDVVHAASSAQPC